MSRGDVTAGLGALVLLGLCCGGPLLLLGAAAIGAALVSVSGVPIIVGFAVGATAVVGFVRWRRRAGRGGESDAGERRRRAPLTRSSG